MRALIHGTRVCQIEAQEFVVASPLEWVDCDGTVTTQHSYVGGQFRPPQPSEFHAWNGSAWAIPPENQAAADAAVAAAVRNATDSAERAQVKADAQIQSDLNLTPAQRLAGINALFPGMNQAQRDFFARLTNISIEAGRKVLR